MCRALHAAPDPRDGGGRAGDDGAVGAGAPAGFVECRVAVSDFARLSEYGIRGFEQLGFGGSGTAEQLGA